jgi:lactoylglutathione lyase
MELQRFLREARMGAAFLAVAAATSGGAGAQQAASSAPQRPRITGISHVGYFVSDLPAALEFWHGLLGFDESYELKKPGSDEVRIALLKINDHQYVELFNEPPPTPPNRMSHICFTVDDVEQMRAYLLAQGVDVRPGNGGKTRMGDDAFEIKDPDGTLVEFVQSLPDGMEAKAAGKFLSAGRISTQIYHAGFVVGNSQRSLDFYGRLLGFQETWRGGSNPNELSWINMRVPDGVDYVEFMLYRAPLDPKTLGGKNHLSLAVPDITKAVAELKSRPAYAAYGKPLEIHTGVNRKRQVNLYDSDGTRVELMEPFTIDGAATAARARLSNDQRHGEAVVALAADGLQRGRGEPRVGCEHRQEAAHTLDALVGAVRVDDLAVADDVVAKDHGAGP